MVRPKIFIDEYLLNWGDKLFYPPVRKIKKQAVRPLPWSTILLPNKPSEIRAQLARTTKKSPEVMVKITSKKNAGKGMAVIRNHLDYISRNGKVELEDHEGRTLNNRADLKDFKEDWSQDISEIPQHRETINVMFSMKKGTPTDEVKEAVREYLKEEFGGKHEYLFALHTDTDHPHVHVVIKIAPIRKKDKRLNPRKNDLQRWREGFAENLRKLDIDANATPRKTRGVVQQALHQYQIHKLARNAEMSKNAVQLKSISLSADSYTQQTQAWANIASALASSPARSDRALAKDVIAFMSNQPIRHINEANISKNAQRTPISQEKHDDDTPALPRTK